MKLKQLTERQEVPERTQGLSVLGSALLMVHGVPFISCLARCLEITRLTAQCSIEQYETVSEKGDEMLH